MDLLFVATADRAYHSFSNNSAPQRESAQSGFSAQPRLPFERFALCLP
jgi:hypothetical protein